MVVDRNRAHQGALGVRLLLLYVRVALERVPAEVDEVPDLGPGQAVDFLEVPLPDVADPEVSGLAVEGEAPGVPGP